MRAPFPSRDELELLGIRELRQWARRNDIAGYRTIGRMSKGEILEMLYPTPPLPPDEVEPPPPPVIEVVVPPADAHGCVGELRVYNYEEAAEILGVGHEWLRAQVGKQAVPHARLGKYVRFTEDHLQEILDAATVPVAAAPVITSKRRTRL